MPYPYDLDYEAKKFKVQPLKTDRNGWKFIILNVLTLGIYSIIFFISLSFDLDKVAPKSDRSKTPNFLAAYILSFFTFSIFLLIWHYHVADRIDDAHLTVIDSISHGFMVCPSFMRVLRHSEDFDIISTFFFTLSLKTILPASL